MSEKALKWIGYSTGIILAMATLWFFVLASVFETKEIASDSLEATFANQLFDHSQILKHLDPFIADQEYLAQTGLFFPLTYA